MASVAKFDTWQAADGTNVARFSGGELQVWDGSAWAAAGATEFNFLVIGGGGAGGGASGTDTRGGGGGAGGYRCSVTGELSGGSAVAESPITVPAGTVTVTVGAGAAGVAGFTTTPNNAGNSEFAGIISVGGGFGGNYNFTSGYGGSSGGAGTHVNAIGRTAIDGIPKMGKGGGDASGGAGTYAGGGGGGAQADGSNASGTTGGAGGSGISSSITGSSVARGGGGGGGADGTGGVGGTGGGGAGGSGPNQDGFNATANTGGGGGGASRDSAGNAPGGNGGSGIVVIKYPDNITLTIDAGLTSSTTSAGGFKTTTFTAGTGPVVIP